MASDASDSTRPFSGKTAWARNLETPLREFIGTETGSAGVLLLATIAALLWINIDSSSYRSVWETDLVVRLGDHSINLDLRGWLNSGLMTLFFFVVGLEARREFDMGELRQRRRVALPVLAGIGGMVVPVLIYLAFNAGSSTAHGWGTAMSTDTAFALGLLALVGPRFPDRLRVFLLTVAIVDDVIALTVIAVVYSGHIVVGPLLVALAVLALILVMRSLGIRVGLPYALLGVAAWLAVESSGIDPIVVGLVLGLLVYASPAARGDLERATDLFRAFREQPTPELARTAQSGVRTAISPNVRLQGVFHPWTSYVIVPLFALANAGIEINGAFLSRAFTSTITLGILIGYVVGKPIGVAGTAWLVTVFSRGRLRPPVGWAAVVGGGTIAGIGFTVSILIATLAFTRRPAGGGQAGRAQRCGCVLAVHVAAVPRYRASPGAAARAGVARNVGGDRRPVGPRGRRARPHPRTRRRACHRRRVRRLRVPVLRPGGGRDARSARGPRRRALRLAPPAPERRASERPARGRGGGGGCRTGVVLGHARPAAVQSERPAAAATWWAMPSSSVSTSTASATTCAAAPARSRSTRTSTRPT